MLRSPHELLYNHSNLYLSRSSYCFITRYYQWKEWCISHSSLLSLGPKAKEREYIPHSTLFILRRTISLHCFFLPKMKGIDRVQRVIVKTVGIELGLMKSMLEGIVINVNLH